eukprot:150835_1
MSERQARGGGDRPKSASRGGRAGGARRSEGDDRAPTRNRDDRAPTRGRGGTRGEKKVKSEDAEDKPAPERRQPKERTAEEIEARREKRERRTVCYNCQQPGHQAKDCDAPAAPRVCNKC